MDRLGNTLSETLNDSSFNHQRPIDGENKILTNPKSPGFKPKTLHFNDLPVEIIARIFSHLDIENLYYIMPVCRLWHAVLNQKEVWQTTFMNRFQIPEVFPSLSHSTSWFQEYNARCKTIRQWNRGRAVVHNFPLGAPYVTDLEVDFDRDTVSCWSIIGELHVTKMSTGVKKFAVKGLPTTSSCVFNKRYIAFAQHCKLWITNLASFRSSGSFQLSSIESGTDFTIPTNDVNNWLIINRDHNSTFNSVPTLAIYNHKSWAFLNSKGETLKNGVIDPNFGIPDLDYSLNPAQTNFIDYLILPYDDVFVIVDLTTSKAHCYNFEELQKSACEKFNIPYSPNTPMRQIFVDYGSKQLVLASNLTQYIFIFDLEKRVISRYFYQPGSEFVSFKLQDVKPEYLNTWNKDFVGGSGLLFSINTPYFIIFIDLRYKVEKTELQVSNIFNRCHLSLTDNVYAFNGCVLIVATGKSLKIVELSTQRQLKKLTIPFPDVKKIYINPNPLHPSGVAHGSNNHAHYFQCGDWQKPKAKMPSLVRAPKRHKQNAINIKEELDEYDLLEEEKLRKKDLVYKYNGDNDGEVDELTLALAISQSEANSNMIHESEEEQLHRAMMLSMQQESEKIENTNDDEDELARALALSSIEY